jgi:hypothetical protein
MKNGVVNVDLFDGVRGLQRCPDASCELIESHRILARDEHGRAQPSAPAFVVLGGDCGLGFGFGNSFHKNILLQLASGLCASGDEPVHHASDAII